AFLACKRHYPPGCVSARPLYKDWGVVDSKQVADLARLVPILGAQAAGASVVSSSSRTGSGSFSSPVCAPACGKMASAHSHRRTAPSASENVTVALPGHDTPPHRFAAGSEWNSTATTV